MHIPRCACWLLLSALATGCTSVSPPPAVAPAPNPSPQPEARSAFLPPPLSDDWSQWLVGDWEGAGESNTGKGKGITRIELALDGQFLISRGAAEITELDPEYLKQHLHATDGEIERFRRSGYQALEIYTIDQKTGEVIGYLFDNLRCVATGRGKHEGFKETVEWVWQNGQKSTRITERVDANRMRITEQTPNPDGSVMEDTGEMVRVAKPRAPDKP